MTGSTDETTTPARAAAEAATAASTKRARDEDTTPAELDADALYHRCDPERFDFRTTDELDTLEEVPGQPRASAAVRFGIGIQGEGFNIYALGPEETDKQGVVEHFVEKRARDEAPPSDLCYVNNFEASHRPKVLALPPGLGCELKRDIDDFLEELVPGLRAGFESEEYQTRRQAVQEEVGEEQEEALEKLRERAREKDLALVRTPAGFVFAPVKEGEVMPPNQLESLSKAEREELQKKIEALQTELQKVLRQVPRRQREARERIRELNREVARYAVRDMLEELRRKYAERDDILAHLDAIQEDVVDSVRQLVEDEDDGGGGGRPSLDGGRGLPGGDPRLRRYRVNVLVDHSETEHAPVVYEDHPTFQNLIGRVEYLPIMGTLITDFNLIQPGALHRANGGYLLLDARQVLLQPFAWEQLKRTLKSGEIRIESPREALGLVSTVSLEPEPIPLDLKVVLLGERLLYYLLSELDPDFRELFKVAADFADEMDRDDEAERVYGRLVATIAKEDGLLPFDRAAVARVVERASRLAGDAEKLSAHTRSIRDLLGEASYWAAEDGADVVSDTHVQEAIDQWEFRSDRVRERLQEQILRDTLYIDTEGERTGQVNGLSVIRLAGFSFGRPNRITARVRLGRGDVTDIDREVELGGPIHSKGVLILQGFLGGRYAGERPLSLSASLVFEQSYSGIEGDSASCAELLALLSAIADVPLRQSIAVTGSVNQHGEVQPIGGVNEKVEGFFDICRARGLTGEQGVLIPRANVKHLMLRDDVREAVAGGRFHLWRIGTVDQGMELLTGLSMGERDEEGKYPEGTINYMVEKRLAELAEKRKEFAALAAGEIAGDEE